MVHAVTHSRFSPPVELERAASGGPLWVALGLAVGPLVAIGLPRFAYAAGQHLTLHRFTRCRTWLDGAAAPGPVVLAFRDLRGLRRAAPVLPTG